MDTSRGREVRQVEIGVGSHYKGVTDTLESMD
jgi:hypothetical protein